MASGVDRRVRTDPPGEDEAVSLRSFFVAAVLWLPLAFFLWYMLRTVVVFLPIRIALATLASWMPDVVTGGVQDVIDMMVNTVAHLDGVPGLPGARLEVPIAINALAYCYGGPILLGLVMATPLTWGRTFAQLAIGYLAILPCQAFGLIGECLKRMVFDYGSLVASGIADAGYGSVAMVAGSTAAASLDPMLAAHGVSASVAALWYQFGTLILPTIVPVVAWILQNRRFIEALTRYPSAEPDAGSGGPSSSERVQHDE